MALTQVALLYYNVVFVINVFLSCATDTALRALRRRNKQCQLGSVSAVFDGKRWALDELFAHLASSMTSRTHTHDSTSIAFTIPVFDKAYLRVLKESLADLEQRVAERVQAKPMALLARDENDIDKPYKFHLLFGKASVVVEFQWEDANSELCRALRALGAGTHARISDFFVLLHSSTSCENQKLPLHELLLGPVKLPQVIRVFGGSCPFAADSLEAFEDATLPASNLPVPRSTRTAKATAAVATVGPAVMKRPQRGHRLSKSDDSPTSYSTFPGSRTHTPSRTPSSSPRSATPSPCSGFRSPSGTPSPPIPTNG